MSLSDTERNDPAHVQQPEAPVIESAVEETGSPTWVRLVFLAVVVLSAVAAISARPLYRSWQQSQAAEFRRTEIRFRSEGLAAHDQGDIEKVLEIAEEWTQWNPNTDDGWLLLADALQSQADFSGTVEALLAVPKSSEKAVPAYLEASHLQFGIAGQPLEGVETCRKILAITPQTIEAQRRIIFYYAITLQRTEMLAEIQNAIAAGEVPLEAFVYLMLADHLMFSNGMELTARWSAAKPETEVFIVAQAIHLNDTLDRAESQDAEPPAARKARRASIRKLLSRFPANLPLFRYFLNQAMINVEIAEVGKLLNSLPDTAVTDSVIWRIRGWYLKEQGQLEAAAEAYRNSLKLHAMDWRARFELSEVIRQLGDSDEARELRTVGLLGKDLRKELVQLPNALEVTPELLKRIEFFARRCGESIVAESIRKNLPVQTSSLQLR